QSPRCKLRHGVSHCITTLHLAFVSLLAGAGLCHHFHYKESISLVNDGKWSRFNLHDTACRVLALRPAICHPACRVKLGRCVVATAAHQGYATVSHGGANVWRDKKFRHMRYPWHFFSMIYILVTRL